MTVDVATFRENFPEFSNASVYPLAVVTFWLGIGALLISASRFGDVYDYALQLFVAHNMALQAMGTTGGGTGSAPGQVVGPLTAANVDKVGYSRDPSAAMDPKNGHWNLTTYGLRYVQLINMFGAGPIQVGLPAPWECEPGAWPGPFVWPYTP